MDLTLPCIVIVVVLTSLYIFRRPRNLPPGPFSIPLIGSIFLLKRMSQVRPHQALTEAAKKYGDVMGFWLGTQYVVALNGFDTVHEALVKHAAVFSGRPMGFKVWAKGLGDDGILARGLIFNQYGQTWRTLRKFTLQVLGDFGVGKTSIEENILTEVEAVSKILQTSAGEPVDIDVHLQGVISNVTFGFVFGRRYDYDDPEFHRVSRITGEALKGSHSGIGNFVPEFLVKLLSKKEFELNNAQIKGLRRMREYITKQVEDHEDTFDKNNIRDFIDIYIRTAREGKEEEKCHLDRENIFRLIMDLFLAGTTTSSTALSWLFLYMTEYPEVQKKCHKDIEQVFGDKILHYADRRKLVYVEATLLEILRHACISPTAAWHSTLSDINFHGYRIPKDTMIIPSIWSACYDPRHWKEPTEFRPERFIYITGKLLMNDALIPFSTGPRQCVGEPLARVELFMVFANLLQRFRFEPEDRAVKMSLESAMDKITNDPLPFKIRIYRRQ